MLSQPWMVFIFKRKSPFAAFTVSITTSVEDEVTVTPVELMVMVTRLSLLYAFE